MATKKGNSSHTKSGAAFVVYEDIRNVLCTQTEAVMIEGSAPQNPRSRVVLLTMHVGLTALRNQLAIDHKNGSITSTDARLRLVKTWLESESGAHRLFELWNGVNTVRCPHFVVTTSC